MRDGFGDARAMAPSPPRSGGEGVPDWGEGAAP